jgi:small GTP-binding protein
MARKLKVVFVGDSGVGKTCICNRAVRGTFSEMTAGTVGANLITLPSQGGNDFTFDIWDTAGQDQYKTLVPMYFRGAQAAIVTFDLTSIESFGNLDGWIEAVKGTAPPDCVLALVGNKLDLEGDRSVETSEAENYAKNMGAAFYIEVSAREGTNVDEIFKKFAAHFSKKAGGGDEGQKAAALEPLAKEAAKKKKGGC